MLSLLGLALTGAAVARVRSRAGAPQGTPTSTAALPPAHPQAPLPAPVRRSVPVPPSAPGAAAVQPGPYPGSALPSGDGSAPSPEYTVKCKEGSKLCHSPSSPYYKRTKAEVWFRTEQDAVAAGFRPWSRNR
ncbi:MAG: hypothetical protein ACRDT0_07985 [Pseudonocardiaceae bacterium]